MREKLNLEEDARYCLSWQPKEEIDFLIQMQPGESKEERERERTEEIGIN